MYTKWKTIFAGTIIFLFVACTSSRQTTYKSSLSNRANNARLLANITMKEFNKKTKLEPNVYKGIGIGKIKGSIEEARNEAINRALFEIAQSYKVTISGKRNLEIELTEDASGVKSKDKLIDNIETSSMAIFRDIKPLICYDDKNQQFLAMIRISKQKLETQIQLHDKKAMDRAQYYFEKALYDVRSLNYVQALSDYYCAFYLASQVQMGTAEYYDRRFKKMYNIQIESRQKIVNLLKNVTLKDKQIAGKEYISFRVMVKLVKSYPMSFSPFLVNGTEVMSDSKGEVKWTLNRKYEHLTVQIDFIRIRKAASMDLYGFVDTDFNDSVFEKFNQFIISFEKMDIEVQFYCKNFPELNSSYFNNYKYENIYLKFHKPLLSPKEIQQVLIIPQELYTKIKLKSIIGELQLKQQTIAGRILLLGTFKGLYRLVGKVYREFEINDLKAIGYNRQEAEAEFKARIKKKLIEYIQ